MNPDISVLIPLFNEREGIPNLVLELNTYFSLRKNIQAEVIFIDDGSTDGSIEALERESHHAYSASAIRLSKNYGSHGALRAGVMHARGVFVTFLPADLQDPPELIEQMLNKAKDGFEVVYAARESVEGQIHDNYFSLLYASLMRKVVSPKYPVRGFDIVLFGKKVRDCLVRYPERDSSLFLQILSFGFSSATLVYAKRRRMTGKSKWTLKKKLKLVCDSVFAYSELPVQLLGYGALLLFGLSLLNGGLYLAYGAMSDRAASTGLLSVFLLGCSVLQASLVVIAEYARRASINQLGRPAFIVSEIRELRE